MTTPGSAAEGSSIQRVAAYVASVGVDGTFTMQDVIAKVPNVSQASRRMRDLRDMGWVIDNYKTNASLAPSEYKLRKIGTRVDQGERHLKKRSNITAAQRRRILERDGHACAVCGVPAGAPFPDLPDRNAVLSIGHVVPGSRSGPADDRNLRAECQRCNEETRNNTEDPPSMGEVLDAITNLGARKTKSTLLEWMDANQRSQSEIDRVFTQWRRLARVDQLEVQAKLGAQLNR